MQASTKAFDSNGQQVMIGGDIVTAVDGKAVATMQDLSAAIKAQKPGDEVELTVLRERQGDHGGGHPGRADGRSGRSDDADGANQKAPSAAQDGGFRRLAGDQRHDRHA